MKCISLWIFDTMTKKSKHCPLHQLELRLDSEDLLSLLLLLQREKKKSVLHKTVKATKKSDEKTFPRGLACHTVDIGKTIFLLPQWYQTPLRPVLITSVSPGRRSSVFCLFCVQWALPYPCSRPPVVESIEVLRVAPKVAVEKTRAAGHVRGRVSRAAGGGTW